MFKKIFKKKDYTTPQDSCSSTFSPMQDAQENSPSLPSRWSALKNSFRNTRQKILSHLRGSHTSLVLDDALLERIEEALIQADCGFEATQDIIEDLRRHASQESSLDVVEHLKKAVIRKTHCLEKTLCIDESPTVILVSGVNGAGKTTSIGKLAHRFVQEGRTVLLAAGDTFRAAATEQLKLWAHKNRLSVISQDKGEPASVIYDAIQSARSKNVDVLIADTAGRLSTQSGLMAELQKVRRIAEKSLGKPPQETILVLDGTMGQNVIHQIRMFREVMGGLTGIILTKLDGSAKGGTILAIAQKEPTPIYFIGLGEGLDDLHIFSAEDYAGALFDDWEAEHNT